jgi:transcriptional regulator with XRE-family HTH domain
VVQTLSQQIAATEEGRRLLQQEDAILDVTELICEIMDETGVSRSELAKRLGTTRGYVTQLLDGSANMTICKVADIFTALGNKLRFSCERDEEYGKYASRISWNIPQSTCTAEGGLVRRGDKELECTANLMGCVA